MTQFGKILVFVNLAFSVFLAALAIGLYVNRVDWSSPSATPERDMGMVAKGRERINQLWGQAAASEERWNAARLLLAARENQREANSAWYRQELEKPETSNQPLQAVDFENGLVKLDPKNYGRPLLKAAQDLAGQPLKSKVVYEGELKAVRKEIQDLMLAYERLGKDYEELTLQLNGTFNVQTQKGDKGLRQRLFDEQLKFRDLLAEQKDIQGMETKLQVDDYILLKRNRQLKARVEELKKSGGIAD
jgi:hypothetical protein